MHDGAVLLDELLAADPLPVANVEPDHVAVLMFTSGTAGAPRAAMLTHGNLLANLEQARSTSRRVGPDDVVYGRVPLYHIFGLNVVLGYGLSVGATVLLVQRFDPAAALESIRARASRSSPVRRRCGSRSPSSTPPRRTPSPASAWRCPVRPSCPVPVAERMRDRFGVTIAEGYGLTEASPVVTSSAGLEPRLGSVGKVLAGVELRLVDSDGEDALVGDVGQVWVRGPNVFAGYLDDPEATARVLTPDGWLRTGDIGVCDDDGWLYLVDRAKDLVIVSGFNVYPAEVEEVLAEHPGVAEVGVAGVPDPTPGETVVAFVVREPGADGRRGRAERARPRAARPLQVPEPDRVRRPAPAQPDGQAAAPRTGRVTRARCGFVKTCTSGLGWQRWRPPRGRRIPEATVARLPVYLRILLELSDGEHRERLVRGAGRSRRGQRGEGAQGPQLPRHVRHRGVGYEVEYLIYQVRRELGLTHDWPVVIVGAGNLGQALAGYGGFGQRGFPVAGMVDVDPAKVGTLIGNVRVRHVDELPAIVRSERVSIGVIATPGAAAQEAADRLVKAGVTSILNFAPFVLSVPPAIMVRKVDLAVELQILSYYEQRRVAASTASCADRLDRFESGRERLGWRGHVHRRHRCEPPERAAVGARAAGDRSRRRRQGRLRPRRPRQPSRGGGGQHVQPHRGLRGRRAVPRCVRRHP